MSANPETLPRNPVGRLRLLPDAIYPTLTISTATVLSENLATKTGAGPYATLTPEDIGEIVERRNDAHILPADIIILNTLLDRTAIDPKDALLISELYGSNIPFIRERINILNEVLKPNKIKISHPGFKNKSYRPSGDYGLVFISAPEDSTPDTIRVTITKTIAGHMKKQEQKEIKEHASCKPSIINDKNGDAEVSVLLTDKRQTKPLSMSQRQAEIFKTLFGNGEVPITYILSRIDKSYHSNKEPRADLQNDLGQLSYLIREWGLNIKVANVKRDDDGTEEVCSLVEDEKHHGPDFITIANSDVALVDEILNEASPLVDKRQRKRREPSHKKLGF